MHRANVLVNYDLPWNPTRIMQRVGRINRVGTEYDRIYVFNFFPTAQSKKQMPYGTLTGTCHFYWKCQVLFLWED